MCQEGCFVCRDGFSVRRGAWLCEEQTWCLYLAKMLCACIVIRPGMGVYPAASGNKGMSQPAASSSTCCKCFPPFVLLGAPHQFKAPPPPPSEPVCCRGCGIGPGPPNWGIRCPKPGILKPMLP